MMSYRSFRLVPLAFLLSLLMAHGAWAQDQPKVVAKAKATGVGVVVVDYTADGSANRDQTGDRARARQAQFLNSDWIITTQDVTISQGSQVLLKARAFPAADEPAENLTYWLVSSLEKNANQLPTQLVNGTIHLDPNNRTVGFARFFITTFEAGSAASSTVLDFNLQVQPQ
jgi:hypothetical protein